MIISTRGVVEALGPVGVNMKDNKRAYAYFHIKEPDGTLRRFGKFRAFGAVDHDLKESVEGEFLFTKAFGQLRLAAATIDGKKRVVAPLDKAFSNYYGATMIVALVLCCTFVGIVFVPFYMAYNIPKLALERAGLRRALKREGYWSDRK